MLNRNVALQHMITKKMMTNLNVLCLRVLIWVVSNLDGTLIVTEERHILHVDAIVLGVCFIHSNLAQQEPTSMYSASAVVNDTQFCFFEDQQTKDRPRKCHVPYVDLR